MGIRGKETLYDSLAFMNDLTNPEDGVNNATTIRTPDRYLPMACTKKRFLS